MKRTLSILCVIAILAIGFTSCKKSGSSGGLTIQGNWELSKVSGMAGVTEVPAGNGNTYKFSGNTYIRYVNGTLAGNGKFTIVQDRSVSISPLAGNITFENPTGTNWFYLLDNNTLVIDFGSAADGPVNTYTRR